MYHLAGSHTESTFNSDYMACTQFELSTDDSVYDSMMSQYLSTTLANTSASVDSSASSSIYVTMSLSDHSNVTGSNPILAELLEKESGFIQLLSELLQLYKVKLINISSEHFDPIFCGDLFDNMKDLHEEMRRQMNVAGSTSKDEIENVCDVFQKNKIKIASVYSKYFTQIDSSVSKLQQLLDENPFLRDIFERIKKAAFEDSQCKAFDLCVVLRVPFQHVLRYQLFFDRLCEKVIPSVAPGSNTRLVNTLEKTAEMMKDLNEHFNECKRNMESLQYLSVKFKDVLDSSDPEEEAKSFGKFLKEEEFPKVKVGKSFWSKTDVLLFQKAVVFHNKTKNLVLKLDTSVVDTHSKPNVMTFRGDSDYRTVELVIKNQDSFDTWKNLVDKVLEVNWLKESNHHKVALESFEDVAFCVVSGKILKGSYCQGYQCSKCKACFLDLTSLRNSKPCQSSPGTSCSNLPALRSFFENHSFTENKPQVRPTSPTICKDPENIDLTSMTNLILGSLDELSEYPWFCPIKNRKTSYKVCSLLPENTFLVRRSENDRNSAALMIKHKTKVHNMKITVWPQTGCCGLTQHLTFSSIPKLVENFQTNSLSTCIPELQTTLIFPFKEGLKRMKTSLDSSKHQSLAFLKRSATVCIENNSCALQPGDIVIVQLQQNDPKSSRVEGFVETKAGSFKSHEFYIPADILEPI